MCCYFFWGVGVCFEITRAGIRKWRQVPGVRSLSQMGMCPRGWKDAIAKDKKRRRHKEKEDCFAPTTSWVPCPPEVKSNGPGWLAACSESSPSPTLVEFVCVRTYLWAHTKLHVDSLAYGLLLPTPLSHQSPLHPVSAFLASEPVVLCIYWLFDLGQVTSFFWTFYFFLHTTWRSWTVSSTAVFLKLHIVTH